MFLENEKNPSLYGKDPVYTLEKNVLSQIQNTVLKTSLGCIKTGPVFSVKPLRCHACLRFIMSNVPPRKVL
jgi:hypothetical protein